MSNGHRGSGSRMAKHWHSIAAVSLGLTADGTSLGGALALDGPWTVIRHIGGYVICQFSAPVANDEVTITVGCGVVSSDAFAAGAGSVPDPAGEPDYPWLYWKAHDFFYSTTDPQSGGADSGSVRVDFDSRSMRKLKPRESLIWVVEYGNIVGAPIMKVQLQQSRILVAT